MPKKKGMKRSMQAKAAAEAKKKKKLQESRPVCNDAGDVSTIISASRRKIELMQDENSIKNTENIIPHQVWTLFHLEQLNKLIIDALCPLCHERGLTVSVNEDGKEGFSSHVVLKCDTSGCAFTNSTMTSPRTDQSDRKNVSNDINTRMALFSHEAGGSFAFLQKFSAVLGIPGMQLKTFQRHCKKVTSKYNFSLGV